MKKSLRNTIMTEEMIVHEKIEEILKEQTLTLDDLNDISIPPNFDFEEVISTVKDYASKTKQNISDLIKNNSFVQSLKRYVSGDTTELSLDQESDREDIEEEDIEQTEVYEGNPHIAKNTLDLKAVGFPSSVKVSDYQLALIAYTLNLFAGKINSSLEKVESIIESKYKTSLKSAFKELFLEEKEYKKFSKDSHEEFINVCLEKQIILKNNGLYEITDKEELFNFIALNKGEYQTATPTGYFIEKLVAISLNDNMKIKSFNIGEKFILCVMLILNNEENKTGNEFINKINKIYKATKVNTVIREYLKKILSKTNIDQIKNIKINKFIKNCTGILNDQDDNYKIEYENKTYDFIVKDKNSQPFVFIDVKLKTGERNMFSTSNKLLLSEIVESFGENINQSYQKIIDDGEIKRKNKKDWDKLANKKFINALFHFNRSYEDFEIKTQNNGIKISLNEDAFKIKYKVYNLQKLFSDVFMSNSKTYSLENPTAFNSNNPQDIKNQYNSFGKNKIKMKELNRILKSQSLSNEYYYDIFNEKFKTIASSEDYSNRLIFAYRSFFDAFRDKSDITKKHSVIYAEIFDEQKTFYKANWNNWYNKPKTKKYIKKQSINLQTRYYYLNTFINAGPDDKSKPDYEFYTYILTKEEGKTNKLKRLYKKYLDVLSNINADDKSKIFKNRLFQALFFENPRKWLDKPVKYNRKEIAKSKVDIASWNKFISYIGKNNIHKSEKTQKNINYLKKYFEE